MKQQDRKALLYWAEYRKQVFRDTYIDNDETTQQQSDRIKKLEADPEAWKRYYFPKFFKYPSPAFHKKATRRLLNTFLKVKHWYEVRHWAVVCQKPRSQ